MVDTKRFMWEDRAVTLNKAAQALGRLGRGKPKTLDREERQRRSEWMKEVNRRRRNDSKDIKAEVE